LLATSKVSNITFLSFTKFNMKFVSVLVVAAFAVSAQAKAAHHKNNLPQIEPHHDFDGFDCTGLEWGDYAHPTECTHYVTCAPDGTHDKLCAECHVNPLNCPDGRLQWSTATSRCEWSHDSDCGGGEPTTTTTEASTTTVESCDPDECKQRGHCDWYEICDPVSRTWVRHECSPGVEDWARKLWWNGNAQAPVEQEGVCDWWRNLDTDTQDRYQLDEECHTKSIDCYWRADGDCDNKYWYLAPGQNHHSKEEQFSCPAGLFWRQDAANCGHCDDCNAC